MEWGSRGERDCRRHGGGIRGESQALHSWVRPVVMVTATRRDEQQTDRIALAHSYFLHLYWPKIGGQLILVPGPSSCLLLLLLLFVFFFFFSFFLFFFLLMKNGLSSKRPQPTTHTHTHTHQRDN